LFIFIKNGFDFCTASPLNILEVGFGTGLNALLTAIKSMTGNRKVSYCSLEKYPLDDSILSLLNHYKFAGEKGREIYHNIHEAQWDTIVNICPNFSLKKINTDFTHTRLEGRYDLIYFDAFGPDKQPEMWTKEMFSSIASVTDRGSILVTYSAKGQVKRNLRSSGFEVTLLPGPPGKRQMIRAIKI
jgi:tRNA U34 5-methylaminomethyl-2-thiouridine-forming methyltransferase MnmC